MPRSDAPAVGTTSRRPDYLGWLALAWAIAFGAMYAAMIVRSRAPGLAEAIGGIAGG